MMNNFEKDMKRLQEIVDNLEKNEIDLNDALKLYEEGLLLSKTLKNQLKQLKNQLKQKGVEEIPTIGETFDPSLHEAVSSIQDPSKNAQEIVQEYRKGYKLGSRVIRHSMVVVAN